MKKEVEILLKRADGFVKDAVEDFEKGRLRPCNVSRGAGMPARFEGKTAGSFFRQFLKRMK
jgi:hypothetical protein